MFRAKYRLCRSELVQPSSAPGLADQRRAPLWRISEDQIQQQLLAASDDRKGSRFVIEYGHVTTRASAVRDHARLYQRDLDVFQREYLLDCPVVLHCDSTPSSAAVRIPCHTTPCARAIVSSASSVSHLNNRRNLLCLFGVWCILTGKGRGGVKLWALPSVPQRPPLPYPTCLRPPSLHHACCHASGCSLRPHFHRR